jgi:hypothetical protein
MSTDGEMGSKTSSSAAVSLLAEDDDDAAAAADTASSSSPPLVARGRLFLIDWWAQQCPSKVERCRGRSEIRSERESPFCFLRKIGRCLTNRSGHYESGNS